jgi:predicted lipid-binding transport protein (Tim44 family)
MTIAIFAGALGLAIGVAALMLSLALPLLLIGLMFMIVLVAFAGVASVLCSPLLWVVGLVWLIWRMTRGSSRNAAPGATIPR